MKKRTLVIGDIHGCYKALIQCFERSKFDYQKDKLIVLGDVCDGWPFVKECIDELLKVKDLIFVIGNHDLWVLAWMRNPTLVQPDLWLNQGGRATKNSYQVKDPEDFHIPRSHIQFLFDAYNYYEEKNNVFVHGGFRPECPIEKQDLEELIWNRQLMESAWRKSFRNPNYKFGKYDTIFLGHTTTQCYKTLEPIFACNVIDMDTGAGWNGKLTIMDVDTKKYWQSDLTPTLYPEIQGRS